MNKYKTEIKWAVIFSACTLAWVFFEKMMGWHDELIAKHYLYTNIFGIVAIVLYVKALKDKKENDLEGQMSWKQGMVSGIALSVFIAILSPLVQFNIATFISPDFFSNAIAYAVESGKDKAMAEAFFNIKSYMLQSVFGALSMGVVAAAIVALFLKNKKNSN
tara:strand:- start:1346 stop:1831 length:486 start_codon:yes stop_codon:yes gene_type:complete